MRLPFAGLNAGVFTILNYVFLYPPTNLPQFCAGLSSLSGLIYRGRQRFVSTADDYDAIRTRAFFREVALVDVAPERTTSSSGTLRTSASFTSMTRNARVITRYRNVIYPARQ